MQSCDGRCLRLLTSIDYKGAVSLFCYLLTFFTFLAGDKVAVRMTYDSRTPWSIMNNVRRCTLFVLRYIYLDNCSWKAHKWCDTWCDSARPTEEFDEERYRQILMILIYHMYIYIYIYIYLCIYFHYAGMFIATGLYVFVLISQDTWEGASGVAQTCQLKPKPTCYFSAPLAASKVIGINEYLIMNSFSGMLHSVIGTQPLLVLRPTGPITLLLEKLHETTPGRK